MAARVQQDAAVHSKGVSSNQVLATKNREREKNRQLMFSWLRSRLNTSSWGLHSGYTVTISVVREGVRSLFAAGSGWRELALNFCCRCSLPRFVSWVTLLCVARWVAAERAARRADDTIELPSCSTSCGHGNKREGEKQKCGRRGRPALGVSTRQDLERRAPPPAARLVASLRAVLGRIVCRRSTIQRRP
jgi:hypothetical protein